MFCSGCGTELISSAKFCANCGAKTAINKKNESTKVNDRKTAWGKWLTLFIPFFFASMFAANYFGFIVIFPILIIILITTILYQRFYNGRSWHSILWGKEKE